MSESLTLITETADRLFADLAGRGGAPFDELWRAVDEAAFPSLLVAEAAGGFGGDCKDLFAVARLAGFHALPLPVADAVLAAGIAHVSGLDEVEGLSLPALAGDGVVTDGRFTGRFRQVPFGRRAKFIVGEIDGRVIRVRAKAAHQIIEGVNPAGEPRDTLVFDEVAAEAAPSERTERLLVLGALVRAAQIAGALDAALALSIEHVNQRVQFGKPLAKFQAVQQALALFAEEAAAVNCAGQAAARIADARRPDLEVAAAKLRANLAAGVGGATAHQVHGAIGFTQEYPLHRFTRRLIAWRAEFGADRFWAERLGRQVADIGADSIWSELVRRSQVA
jgi:acyl-CoA dehydrogenase